MKYQHIFWDWNGTVLNDAALCHQITNILLEKIGKPAISLDLYRKKLRHPIKEFYEEITAGGTEHSYSWFSDTFHAHYAEKRYECKIHDFVEDDIAFFKSHNAKQSILSAHPQELLNSMVEHLKLRHHFDHIIGAPNNLAKDKYAEGVILMELYNADPSKTLIIGDTAHDAEVATHLGIDCIIVAKGMQCKTKLTHLNVPVLDCMSDVIKIVSDRK